MQQEEKNHSLNHYAGRGHLQNGSSDSNIRLHGYSGQRKSQAKFLQTTAEKGIVWDLPLPLTIPVAVFLRWVGRRATARHWHRKRIQY